MDWLPTLLAAATLLPLASFFTILVLGPRLGKPIVGGYLAATAIVSAGVLSFISLFIWVLHHYPEPVHHGHDDHAAVAHADPNHDAPAHADPADADEAPEHADPPATSGSESAGEAHDTADGDPKHESDDSHAVHGEVPPHITGVYYTLGRFGDLKVNISYYIDALTIAMFCMVTLIASCIHFYAMGYMHDEEHDVTDHEVTLRDGSHLHRPGRFYRFFQYLSLFCFSMLGLVLAGNIAMVFVFWELVGVCSYFLIGFYVERQSASTAANKAFITNRIGDFGMIIGLMALWASLGTFAFGDLETVDADGHAHVEHGIFSQLRAPENEYQLAPAPGMVQLSAAKEMSALVKATPADEVPVAVAKLSEPGGEWANSKDSWGAPYGYVLLVVAGLGIFCGCVGKSAQFPLHVWLPDAMEGPTPVSALVHSATMVAAGVYLVGRFFPVFTPEVLMVIAFSGCITLFLGATIAITATDIKRVLAYSTISQLGYMMLALGVGGWIAGVMHLITHAFFKSLLFMCSGSVIHAVHTNELTQMGGLFKKMPITAITMLIGCLAIAGAGVPFLVGFSGYYSKDIILEQAFSYWQTNGGFGGVFFATAAGGAAITAFYMFRMWYLAFVGQPRDRHRYDHAHESPPLMYMPLVIISVFAVGVAWQWDDALWAILFSGLGLIAWYVYAAAKGQPLSREFVTRACMVLAAVIVFVGVWTREIFGFNFHIVLENLLEQARPAGTLADATGALWSITVPSEPKSHAYANLITPLAFGAAASGFALATFMYGLGYLNPDEVRKQFSGVYRFLVNKWYFDELYDFLFIKPTLVIGRLMSNIDRDLIDGLIHRIARGVRQFSVFWDGLADRAIVDGTVNQFAAWTYAAGLSLRRIQTGQLRQYVMYIALAAVVLFLLISFLWNPALLAN